jgi:type II secretory ATPase GspE/PulE/Tfp pilus assembly ATPase PilB-like protein
MSDMDISNKLVPQDGKFEFEVDNKRLIVEYPLFLLFMVKR